MNPREGSVERKQQRQQVWWAGEGYVPRTVRHKQQGTSLKGSADCHQNQTSFPKLAPTLGDKNVPKQPDRDSVQFGSTFHAMKSTWGSICPVDGFKMLNGQSFRMVVLSCPNQN